MPEFRGDIGSLFEGKLEGLLVELCFQLSKKNPDRLIEIARAQGKQIERDGDIVKVKSGNFACAVCLGAEPLEQLQPLMFALFGLLWSMVFGEEFNKASKKIKAKIKEARNANATVQKQ